MNRKLNEDNQACNDWKFQIHWNKIEWVNLRIHDERKNPFCVSSFKNVLKITLKLHIRLVTCNQDPYIHMISSKGHQLLMENRLV